MHDYQNLSTPLLVSMLAKHSKDYTKMLFNNDRTEVFDNCEKTIFLLQAEINSRIPDAEHIVPTEAAPGMSQNQLQTQQQLPQ